MMQVAFSDSAKDDAFTRSGGRCECTLWGSITRSGLVWVVFQAEIIAE
jgi:hypothetical protein